MGAQHDLCPTCGSSPTPPTPQQDEEPRHALGGTSARSLTASFEALEVAPAGDAGCSKVDRAGGETISLRKSLEMETDGCSASAAATGSQARQGNHDADEPILQDNDERFCLLPVK